MYEIWAQQKNPKTQTEVLKWIETTIPEFGIATFKPRELIDFLKVALENVNPGVKKGAIEVFVVLRIQIGPSNQIFSVKKKKKNPLFWLEHILGVIERSNIHKTFFV